MNQLHIGEKYPAFIIAEIGQNHQGDVKIAKRLIEEAKVAGANCVKFQKSSLSNRFTQKSLLTKYNSLNSFGLTYGEHRRFLEFSAKDFEDLKNHAEKNVGIMFSSSAMDMPSVDYLASIDVPFIKIGSGDGDNLHLLTYAAEKRIPLIISTGMQEYSTVYKVYALVKKFHQEFAILQCVSSYPTKPEDINLAVIDLFKENFPEITVGYSGHEEGTLIATAAVARGAKIIERHLTLDKTWKGSDHKCSLEPQEFKKMVEDIRLVEKAIGKPRKKFLPCEAACHAKLGKTIVTTCQMEEGDLINEDKICVKVSHSKGLSPVEFFEVIGHTVLRPLPPDTPVRLTDLSITKLKPSLQLTRTTQDKPEEPISFEKPLNANEQNDEEC